MDRETAKQYVNKFVVINKGLYGKYVGVLNEIISEPKKPWSGKITIKGILSTPLLDKTEQSMLPLAYEKDESVTVNGSKIDIYSGDFKLSYRESFAQALKREWDQERDILEQKENHLLLIQQELKKWQMEHVLDQASYVYYKVTKKGKDLYIYDELKEDSLLLDGCPFEFEIQIDAEWVSAWYDYDLFFRTEEGNQLKVADGTMLRLNKEQFDPYKMLTNELEPASLQALEKGLKQLNIGHENCVHCHNSLLIQLLAPPEEKQFSGVNFISYSTGSNQILVQHHYERIIKEKATDYIFDRFEFTSDKGSRSIASYTTEVSQD
ncbi:DUF2777 family protein [Alkalicoccus daliensis]|uniref:DUF2777 family protein n=1 Tax=Alkalicoccus daliensis TaxID=745820 RepID=A0A1H0AQV3_9BACI|nr:DUF2777 family protein [Alkalicoccus daliensis]SDN35761.1 Protein of unknown function [Alkalicoccus daliensis]